jgi:hypothetical protein
MTALRRLAVIGSVAAVTVTLAAAGASADELTDYLERSNQSTYSANRLVVSVWGGQTQITSSFVEHSQGMEIIQVDSTWSMVGNGTAMTMDDAPHGVAFMSSSEPISTDRYVVGGVTQVTHMGRTCELVRVMEGDTVRARLLVDVRTGAPLITESFTDDGRVFRRSSLQNFLAYRTYSGPSSTGGAEYDIVLTYPRLLAIPSRASTATASSRSLSSCSVTSRQSQDSKLRRHSSQTRACMTW